MVELIVTNNEREDILFGLRLWVRDSGSKMKGNSKKELEALIDKVDCAGEPNPSDLLNEYGDE